MCSYSEQISQRSGMELFADFYTLSSFFTPDNHEDCEIAAELLPLVKREVLRAAAIAILSEMKYWKQEANCKPGHLQVFHRFGVKSLVERSEKFERIPRYYYIKRNKALIRMIACGKVIFGRPGAFSMMYGGPKWAEICKRWFALHEFHDFASREMFNRIDYLIDAAHNTGRCLDKVYPHINKWLEVKTLTQDPYWVINQSCLRRYAKIRMKQQYFEFSEERFQNTYMTIVEEKFRKDLTTYCPILPVKSKKTSLDEFDRVKFDTMKTKHVLFGKNVGKTAGLKEMGHGFSYCYL